MPSAEQLEAARKKQNLNIVLDRLDRETTRQIKEFCRAENARVLVENGGHEADWKVTIFKVNFEFLERIELILENTAPAPGVPPPAATTEA